MSGFNHDEALRSGEGVASMDDFNTRETMIISHSQGIYRRMYLTAAEVFDLDAPRKEFALNLAEHFRKGGAVGDISDGYHTFNELYHHRALLFATICNMNPDSAWKSMQHDDPNFPMYDGMFICGIETPGGQATYHCNIDPYWNLFHVKVLDRAPWYDGHTPEQALMRIFNMFNKPI